MGHSNKRTQLYLIKMSSSLYRLILVTLPAPSLEKVSSSTPLSSQRVKPPRCLSSLFSLFSCKCVQIENIVHQRGPPSLLRRFALAFLLFPWERCSLSSVTSLSHSRLPLSLFDKQPGGMAIAGSLSKLFSCRHTGRGKEREMFLQPPPSDIPAHVSLFSLPLEDELFYGGM